MRFASSLLLVAACSYSPPDGGDDDDVTPDSSLPDAYVLPTPELFPGGGVGGGPIVAGMNVFAVDEDTDLPIAGATVTIGEVTGTTDSTGLFTSTDARLAGKQAVLITATGYRPQLWVGVAGANVTIQLDPIAAPPQGSIAGNITGFGTLPVAAGVGHQKRATIGYTQHDNASDAVNNIRTANNTNSCVVIPGGPADDCNYAVNTRTGTIGLFAAINDYNTKNTGTTQDDTQTLITYAYKTGITVDDGVSMTGQALTPLAQSDLVEVTTGFGTPPSGLGVVFGLLAIELPAEGYAVLNLAVPGVTTRLPKTSVFPGSTYRLIGFAGAPDNSAFSVPIRRGLSTTTIEAGSWLTPPADIVATRQSLSFTASPGNLHVASYGDDSGSYLGIVILDGSTSITIPAEVSLPTSALTVAVEGVTSTLALDDFGFDADRAAITDLAFRFVVLP